MTTFLCAITIIHGLLFRIDEFKFHKKRGLKKVELINALFDGALFIGALIIPLFTTYSYWWEKLYIAMCICSCLSIIKNEFFYKGLEIGERVTHALLYVLHPVILFAYYDGWKVNYFDNHYYVWMIQLLYVFLGVQAITYQIIYWNYIHDDNSSNNNSD
ncbi:MAG: hypothetical protein KC493_10755 [Bacteriovoracaceae bacterium]|nr:hypothetical protein [Bacteriovoracaceae bacterium]